MLAQRLVWDLTEFDDIGGGTVNIPSIGQAQVDEYVEDTDVRLRPFDTGQFQFVIDQYISSGTYITYKNERDSFLMDQFKARFLPEQERAIREYWETYVLATPERGVAVNSNETIDGFHHRFAASGANSTISLADVAYAKLALDKAKASTNGRVGIVDPTFEFSLNKLTNLINVSNNPKFEGIVNTGMANDMHFLVHIFGFDIYTSNRLADVTDPALPQSDGSTTANFSSVAGKANLFYSADPQNLPMVGRWTQTPTVNVVPDPRKQRTEYFTVAEFGVSKYREEVMVSLVTTSAAV